MEVKGINSYNSSNKVSNTRNNLGEKDIFLKILAAELSNQDPMNAKDNTQYITQLAQFTSLEQSQNLNANLSKILTSQRITEGTMLLGKNIEIMANDNSMISDVVNKVRKIGNDIYLECVKGTYHIDNVIGVGENNDSKTAGTTETI